MWQKCWNTNQSLVHNLRFRERGPLKSWRPETMAEAIFSVLKEGLSLSQAARKYDIPYPTFVLYANRVHNMLGPSADGGAGLRHQMCSMVAAAHSQQHDMMATNLSTSLSTSLSSNLQAAMQASQHHNNNNTSGSNASGLGGGSSNSAGPGNNNGNSPLNLGLASPGSGGPPESPMESPLASPLGPLMDPAGHIPSSVEVGIGVSGMTYKPARSFVSPRPENLFQEDIADLVKSPHGLKDKDKIPVKLEPLTDSRCE
ncbi:hypothetical protein DMN91_011007 [Ooceraea biroi]|uniref:HTH psq-type domain-containing protein n=1 Tax=Ooceraea biroi TaxID=2015173 RepID=A0A3L8DAJ1_OOCBI|nr:hypothetical protein DMN91_011007 [Ooceraea biroi]